MPKIFPVLLALAAFGLSACETAAVSGGAPAEAREAFDASGYRLASGDEVRLTVFGEPDLSGVFELDGQGQLTLQLAGAVQADGLTPAELADAVADALRQGYLKDPRVTAEVATYRPYYILGEVEKPGEYAYQNGLTVLNAVATAEGFTYRANEKAVFIRRDGETEERKFRLDNQTPVRPGDTIRVGERFL